MRQRPPLGSLAHGVGDRSTAAAGAVGARLCEARNQTDAADAAAPWLAGPARCRHPAAAHQKRGAAGALQALHRSRSLWIAPPARLASTRCVASLSGVRAIGIAVGSSRIGLEQIARGLADPKSALPELAATDDEPAGRGDPIAGGAHQPVGVRKLTQLAPQSAACKTAAYGAPGVSGCAQRHRDAGGHTGGEVTHFQDARHFASWFGLTPKESSSGMTRRLGRISKRSERYLRMLLTHGARSVLGAATVANRNSQAAR